MKVNRIELRNILTAVRPGLALREFQEQTCHFVFSKTEISTFNGKVCITHPYKTDDAFSVKGEEFFRLIDGIPDDEINLALIKNKVQIRSKTTTASMAILAEEQATVPAMIAEARAGIDEWKSLPSNFTEGASLCSFSCCPDLTRGIDACVMFEGPYVASKDTARACLFTLSKDFDDSIFIAAKEAMELSKFPVTEFCADEKWGHFKTEDNVIFTCRILKGNFPLEKMISVYAEMGDLPRLDFPSELKQVVESTAILAGMSSDQSGKYVKITIKDGEMIIRAENELGVIEKSLLTKYEGDPIDVDINYKFLSQILDKATSVSFKGNMVHFLSGSFQHVIATMNRKG